MGQSESTFKITAQWEWQSNPNPWSSEPIQWTPYGPMDNYFLEKAFQSQEKKVELEDFIVFMKDREMVQQRKNDPHRQRRVRRNEEYQRIIEESKANEEDQARKKRFFGAETPKSYKKIFGSLEQFLVFFENRGPEMKKFVTVFKEVEESQDMNRLNQQTLPLLVNSIKQEAAQSKNSKPEKVLKLFQKNFASIKDFYGDILKAYTMDTFLYDNLNQYLRNEDWMGLDYLLPYAFCLCKAFFWPEITGIGNENNNNSNQDNNGQTANITLYRGAQLDEVALSLYDSPTFPIFSWNGVTSTSTNRKVAEQFMYNYIDIKKIPVMFVIETSLSSDEIKNLKWIDIKPFSACPMEEEIVLGPGSTFKLIKFQRDQKGAEISLKLVDNVDTLTHQGQIMQIAFLEGKELEEAIIHLKGNRLIEELELVNLDFGIDTLAKLKETLSTLTNLTRLDCYCLSSNEKKRLEIMLEALGKQKMLLTLETNDASLGDEQIMNSFAKKLGTFASLTTLNINFGLCGRMTNKGIDYLSSKGIRYLTSLTTLTLDFTNCDKITDEGIMSLCSQGIRHLSSLITLTLDIAWCNQITDSRVLALFSQVVTREAPIKVFNLYLPWHLLYLENHLTLEAISAGISFSIRKPFGRNILKFMRKVKMGSTDGNIKDKENKIPVSSMDALNIDSQDELLQFYLESAENIQIVKVLTVEGRLLVNDQELLEFCSKRLRHLTLLTTLNLDFEECSKITDEGITSLCSQGIRHLTSLTALTLNFIGCESVSCQGLNHLVGLLKYFGLHPQSP